MERKKELIWNSIKYLIALFLFYKLHISVVKLLTFIPPHYDFSIICYIVEIILVIISSFRLNFSVDICNYRTEENESVISEMEGDYIKIKVVYNRKASWLIGISMWLLKITNYYLFISWQQNWLDVQIDSAPIEWDDSKDCFFGEKGDKQGIFVKVHKLINADDPGAILLNEIFLFSPKGIQRQSYISAKFTSYINGNIRDKILHKLKLPFLILDKIFMKLKCGEHKISVTREEVNLYVSDQVHTIQS